MSTAITIDSVSKHYAPGTPPAVDRVSLSIEPGDLFFLLGPSGCGKTTLLRMIAGFIEPTGGRILFGTDRGEQRDVTHLAPNKRNTGMVFQSYALWPHMTVLQNVTFGLEVRRVEKAEMKRRAAEALDLVQMGAFADRRPNALSGGQQQRVALARALVVRPDVLLLDEPLSNLDAKLRVELRSEIRRICKSSGITTVYVTHDQKEALSMADRVAIMRAGKVVQLGGPAELYRKPANRFVAEFLGETNFLPAHAAADSTAGWGRTPLSTTAGPLVSAHAAPPGPNILVSLRPEALRVLAPGETATNILSGTVAETTYLGELVQHIVDLDSTVPLRVKVAVLNPAPTDHASGNAPRPIKLAVAPEDVVLVPSE